MHVCFLYVVIFIYVFCTINIKFSLKKLMQMEKDVETHGTCFQSLVNSDSLNQTKLTYKIHTDLKNITSSIQKFAEVVVES